MVPVAAEHADGFWLGAMGGVDHNARLQGSRRAVGVVASMLDSEWQRARTGEALSRREDEIDLLYGLSEVLGQTARLEDAADTVVREVSSVLGARRVSVMLLNEAGTQLRTIAARGFDPAESSPVPIADEASIAARVFRERRAYSGDDFDADLGLAAPNGREYRGQGFLSVPISYAAPGSPLRCLGVLSLSERLGTGAFSPADRKLLGAIANLLGAAIENTRLVVRDRQQQRLRRELELAHDLQLRLLPSPAILQGVAEVAARSRPAESVGGDFYTFNRLGAERVGVMLGDVSSHGFSAALVMALVLSAAGIHAAQAESPDDALDALLDSVSDELRSTDMYFTVFYGLLDRKGGVLSYANAGHPYAYRLPPTGEAERLAATCAPLGLVAHGGIQRRQVAWNAGDLLVLFTDGLIEARNGAAEPYGEPRLLAQLTRHRHLPLEKLVDAVLADADAWSPHPADDRTLLVLRV